MAKKRPPVKVVSIQYGLLGNPNNRKIEKAINAWIKKGYRLEKRDESVKHACMMTTGKTHLTFFRNEP